MGLSVEARVWADALLRLCDQDCREPEFWHLVEKLATAFPAPFRLELREHGITWLVLSDSLAYESGRLDVFGQIVRGRITAELLIAVRMTVAKWLGEPLSKLPQSKEGSISQKKDERGKWMIANCDPQTLTDDELMEAVNANAVIEGWPLYESGNGAFAGFKAAYLKAHRTPYLRDNRGKSKRTKQQNSKA